MAGCPSWRQPSSFIGAWDRLFNGLDCPPLFVEEDQSCDGKILSERTWKTGKSRRHGPLAEKDGKVLQDPLPRSGRRRRKVRTVRKYNLKCNYSGINSTKPFTRNQHYRLGWTIGFYVLGKFTMEVSNPTQVSIDTVDIGTRLMHGYP